MSKETEVFSDCWIDILGFTKKDWETIEELAAHLMEDNQFGGDGIKCIAGAVALFVDSGKGLRDADH